MQSQINFLKKAQHIAKTYGVETPDGKLYEDQYIRILKGPRKALTITILDQHYSVNKDTVILRISSKGQATNLDAKYTRVYNYVTISLPSILKLKQAA